MNKSSANWLISKFASSVLLAVLLLAGGVLLWEERLKDHFIPRHFGVVEKGRIYRSGQISSSLIKETIAKHKIAMIVSLSADSANNADKVAEKQAAAELGIERVVFPLGGSGTGDVNSYANAIAAICRAQKEQKPVLIHCDAGVQRTGGVIAAYQLLVEKKDVAFVVEEMRHYGWKPKDNTVLVLYLNSNMKKLADILQQKCVIDSVPSPLPQIIISN